MDKILEDDIEASLEMYLNREWVTENADRLFKTIDTEIRNPETVENGAKRLLLIYPRLIGREDIKEWARLSDNTLRKMELNVTTRNPLQPEYFIAPTYVFKRQDHRTQVKQKTRRRRHRLNPRQMLETYMILMTVLYYRHLLEVTPDIINDALGLARMVNSDHHYHKLYQTLCVVFTQQGYFDNALNFGELAFNHFEQVGDELEMALSAYALAQAYYGKRDSELTDYWLNLAADLFARKDYPEQFAAIDIMRGCIAMVDERYKESKQWLENARKEYEVLNQPFRIALAGHYTGMAQALAGELDEAYANISEALEQFEASGNTAHRGYALHTLAYTQSKMGNDDDALRSLDESQALLESLPDSGFKDHYLQKVVELREAIHAGQVDAIKIEY